MTPYNYSGDMVWVRYFLTHSLRAPHSLMLTMYCASRYVPSRYSEQRQDMTTTYMLSTRVLPYVCTTL